MKRKRFLKAIGFGAVSAAAFRVTGKPEAQALTSMQHAFDACEAEPCPNCGGYGKVITIHRDRGNSWQTFEPCPDCGGPKIHWTSTQERVHWENSDWGELE